MHHTKFVEMKSFIIILLIMLILPGSLLSNNFSEVMKKANDSYQRGEYEKALNSYKLVYDNGYLSSDLYYNMANAYGKLNKFGYAILYYEKALFLNPNNSNAIYNLKIINKKNIDKIISQSGKAEIAGVNQIYNFLRGFSMSLLVYVFLFFWVLIWGILIAKKLDIKFFKTNSFTFLTIFFSIIALFNFVLIIGNYYSINNITLGVVIAQEIDVIDGPDDEYKKLFKIHEGLKVEITKERGDWFQITLPNGNVGWVKTSQMKKI